MALASPAARRSDGSGAMFDGIAARYDLLNRLNSLGLDRGWRRATAEALAPAAGARRPPRMLDVASGTGDIIGRVNRSIDHRSLTRNKGHWKSERW